MNDILVISRGIGELPREARYAAQLGHRLSGWVSGLSVIDADPPLVAHEAPVAGEIERQQREAKRLVLGERSAFRRLLRELGISGGDWEVAQGPIAEVAAYASRWHDLLVVRADRSGGDPTALLSELVLRAKSACLVVPHDYDRPARLDCVALAYNGSPESIRAIHAAIPLLRHARRVVLLRGRRRKPLVSAMTEAPTFDVVEHLARRGIKVERQSLEDPEQSSGEEIVDAAARLGADLLVMGAYGRSRLAERILGGATRHALRTSTVPLLMRH
ncbi:MAG TPA: universal stress protein [Xanthomonadales bacterium]|nr:universal stress protein [Xanthomonadales bacterium]